MVRPPNSSQKLVHSVLVRINVELDLLYMFLGDSSRNESRESVISSCVSHRKDRKVVHKSGICLGIDIGLLDDIEETKGKLGMSRDLKRNMGNNALRGLKVCEYEWT